jgi:hypothetical protein
MEEYSIELTPLAQERLRDCSDETLYKLLESIKLLAKAPLPKENTKRPLCFQTGEYEIHYRVKES